MTPPGSRNPPGAAEDNGAEGWESLAEEAEAGALKPNPEFEDSLRAADAAGGAAGESAENTGRAAQDAADSAETAADSEAEAASAANAAEAAARLAALEAEHAQLLDRHLRLQADFDNHRKRTARERGEAQAAGLEKLARDLLGGLDDLERAQQFAAQPDGKLADLQQGVELVRQELLGALSRHGLCEVEALGAPFDPKVHEAMAQALHPEAPPGQVLEVLQRGYRLGGRLLRPARVVVAKAPAALPAGEAQSAGEAQPAGEDGNGGGGPAVDR
ncbi:MAG: nucleotide exchange factor GrpE [Deltaproteobacteria bacterium]|nr:nucleotide exchange factor GrpE [Deltaproteobacteria bacterium]